MADLNILNDCKELMDITWNLCKNNPEFKFTINSQIIRSCLSIGSNIAEGCERKGKDRCQLLNIALGSLAETRFQFQVYPNFDYQLVKDKLDKIKAVIIRLRDREPSPLK